MATNRQQRWWPTVTAGLLILTAENVCAQLIVDQPQIIAPPWISQRIFDVAPLPQLSDPADRDPVAPEDTPVRTRVHPEYQPRGARQGAWMFYPTVAASGFYDSNVYASANKVEDDFVSRFAAGLRAQSLWERHNLEVQLATQSLLYAHHPGLNQSDVEFKARGRIDVDHATQILTTLQAAFLHVEVGSLNSPGNAAEPTPYGFLSGDATLRKQFGRFTASIGARADSYDFGETRALNGATINQDFKDGQIYKAYERLEYAISEKTALFASFENNWRQLRGSPGSSLDSKGYRALAGIDLEITRLIRGELAAGYQSQNFDSPSITDVAGPAYRVFLTWSPTRRLDFRFNAEQVITQISDTSTSSVLASAIQAGIDYELRPNLVLSGTAIFEQDQFKGQPRDDDVYAAELRLKRAFNNVTSASIFYRYLRRDSNIPMNSYDRQIIGVSASAQF
jgi:hypothetical protein